MRIVSFLPGATEMLFALGLGEQVVGVTFECDYPLEAAQKTHVVQSHLPAGLSPSAIDAIVRAKGAEGRSLYFADFEKLENLSPELIVLQDLCKVCAIDSPTLARDVSRLGSSPRIISLSAHTLQGVLKDIQDLATAAGAERRAADVVEALVKRIDAVKRLSPVHPRPRVLALEWLDPFFQGGHWVPEMIELAGGDALLAAAGEKSVRLQWEQVAAVDPEVLVIMPCGYHLEEAAAQYRAQNFPAGWERLHAVKHRRVYAVDGSAYFSRPGPRLVDGLELLAKMFREEPGDYLRL